MSEETAPAPAYNGTTGTLHVAARTTQGAVGGAGRGLLWGIGISLAAGLLAFTVVGGVVGIAGALATSGSLTLPAIGGAITSVASGVWTAVAASPGLFFGGIAALATVGMTVVPFATAGTGAGAVLGGGAGAVKSVGETTRGNANQKAVEVEMQKAYLQGREAARARAAEAAMARMNAVAPAQNSEAHDHDSQVARKIIESRGPGEHAGNKVAHILERGKQGHAASPEAIQQQREAAALASNSVAG